MATNRHLIDDFDVRRSAQLLDKGLPLPGLSGRYVVDEGWVGIITEGGAYRDTLQAGTYFLSKYRFFRDIKAVAVDTRIQTLHVSTTREFTISRPVPVQVNLDLSVEYRVSDPRRVALEVKTPLTNLYDRVIQAVRSAIAYATIDEIRTQGEGIASTTLQRLQAMQLPKVIGIEIFNVLVTTIKATDTSEDALATQQLSEYTTYRDWQLDQTMLSQSQMTWEWLLVHRPEIAQQMLATYGEVAKEMIDKGLLDPAGFLNQPTDLGQGDMNLANPANLLQNFGFPGLPGQSEDDPAQQRHLRANADRSPSSGSDIHTRMREEVRLLQKETGVEVETTPGVDSSGIPDGSYNLRVKVPRISGGTIIMYIACLPNYPQHAPAIDFEVDGQDRSFESTIMRRWNGQQYLVEIAREAKGWFG